MAVFGSLHFKTFACHAVGAPSKKNRASKGGRKLISACDAANSENEVSQVVSGIPHDQKVKYFD